MDLGREQESKHEQKIRIWTPINIPVREMDFATWNNGTAGISS